MEPFNLMIIISKNIFTFIYLFYIVLIVITLKGNIMQYKTIESLIESIQKMNSEIDSIDQTLINSYDNELNKSLNANLDFLCNSVKKQKEFLNSYIEYLTNQSL